MDYEIVSELEVQHENYDKNVKCTLIVEFEDEFTLESIEKIKKVVIFDDQSYCKIDVSKLRVIGVVIGAGLTKEGLRFHQNVKHEPYQAAIVYMYYCDISDVVVIQIPSLLTRGRYPFNFCVAVIPRFPKKAEIIVLSDQTKNYQLKQKCGTDSIISFSTVKRYNLASPPPENSYLVGFAAQVIMYCQAYGWDCCVVVNTNHDQSLKEQLDTLIGILSKDSSLKHLSNCFIKVLPKSLNETLYS